MFQSEQLIKDYLEYCKYQKKLNEKTIKAYKIDLKQFLEYMQNTDMQPNRINISSFVTTLHKSFKPKTAKRKIASLKAFFAYLEYEEILLENPFSRLKVKFQEPFLLPRTIAVQSLKSLFEQAYQSKKELHLSKHQRKVAFRDIAVLELLFATGLRVSELCAVKQKDINFKQGTVLIYGKGSKERMLQLTNVYVLDSLLNYRSEFQCELQDSDFFFINRQGHKLSEQSVRFMIKKYAGLAGIHENITPHMFRHTFATMLLEEDVDVRYIQQILGHSSILTTQIYTHVTSNKQREILTDKHPRNRLGIGRN